MKNLLRGGRITAVTRLLPLMLFVSTGMAADALAQTAPTISPIADHETYDNGLIGPITIAIGDADTPAGQLVVTASSANPSLLALSGIAIAGTGATRTLTLTPGLDQVGETLVTVTVGDGSLTKNVTFTAKWFLAEVVDLAGPGPTRPGVEHDNIAAALTAALNDVAATEAIVVLRDGTYTGANNREIFVDTATKPVTIRSERGPSKTIIDLEYAGRAFAFVNNSEEIVIDGLTMTRGTPSLLSYGDNGGGAIYFDESSSAVIRNCIFRGNLSDYGGAIGIIFGQQSSRLLIADSEFSRNNTSDDVEGGGAVHVGYSPSANDTLEIRSSRFLDNHTSASGGAISMRGNRTHFSVTNSTFDGNSSSGNGGAIESPYGSSAAFTNCTFVGNKTLNSGGAIFSSNSPLTVVNSVIRNNESGYSGSAISAFYSAVTVSSSTIANNFSPPINSFQEAYAVFVYEESAWIQNSIVWGNLPRDAGSQIFANSVFAESSDIDGGIGGIGSGTINAAWILDADPGFALDSRLMPGSPLIDAGDNLLLPADTADIDGDGDTSEPIPIDLGARRRIQDGTVDIGAYELDRASPALTTSKQRISFTARENLPPPDSQAISIGATLPPPNPPQSPAPHLAWRIAEDVPWLRVENPLTPGLDPAEGNATFEPADLDFHVDHSSLSPGRYAAQVEILDGSGPSVLTTVDVTLNVTRKIPVPSATFGTIQAAIDAAIDGDDVVVAASSAHYIGTGNTNLDFRGKTITLESSDGPAFTTIDCEDQPDCRGVDLKWGEGSGTVIRGLTITRGNHTSGAAINGSGASPTIVDSVFMNNQSSGSGGAIYLSGARGAVIANSVFRDNNAGSHGGGVYIDGSARLENLVFDSNSASSGGGGAALEPYAEGGVVIRDSTFAENFAAANGGGLYADGVAPLTIIGSKFSGNSLGSLGSRGGGAIYADAPHSIRNSLFFGNKADAQNKGAALYSEGDGISEIVNSTFANNNLLTGGGPSVGIVRVGLGSSLRITNSILWFTTELTTLGGFPSGTITKTYSNTSSSAEGADCLVPTPINPKRNIDCPPGFVDAANGDFRLDSFSPAIDAGTFVPNLFSDIRGSLRPIDAGIGAQGSLFDMGAYEYSRYYGGLPGDLEANAFDDFSINGSTVVTGFDYQIAWKDRNPFPFDPRILQAGAYDVNLVLVDSHGLRREIGTYTVQVTQQGYEINHTFGPADIGTWRLRLELAADPGQYVLSDEISIEYKERTRYALGGWIRPPSGADPNVKPDVADEDRTYWSVATNRLYGIAPTTTVVTWYADQDRTLPLPVVAWIDYPDQVAFPNDPTTLIHIADTQPVELLPAGSNSTGWVSAMWISVVGSFGKATWSG